MVNLFGQYLHIREEIDAAIQAVIRDSVFIKGKAVQDFAAALSSYLNVKHTIPCANGTDALQIALMALDLEPGDEVIVPAFTFVSTAEVVRLLGLVPVFVDVDAKTFNINAEQLEVAFSARTKAIIPVHLFGQCADMEAVMSFAEQKHIAVIEDNAQALGARYAFEGNDKRFAGTIGQLGTTSFFPSKILGCFGDGGAIFSNDDRLAEKCQMIANHGQKVKYQYEMVGVNSRLDTLQAALLNVKLKYIDSYIQQRRAAAAQYVANLEAIEDIILPGEDPASDHVWHQFTIRVNNTRRDALKTHLQKNGIPSMIYYPSPLHWQKAYEDSKQRVDLSVSEQLCQEVLSLPMHTELSGDAIKYVSDTITSFFRL
jgi:dTDP-4-amino-4,6-dideoxygalactose transaminase